MKAKDRITYKGFIGSVHFSEPDDIFFGRIEGVDDLITFEGESVKELKKAFRYVVDEHIKDCEKEKIRIEKSYTGSFNIRLSPDFHRRTANAAKNQGITLNAFVKNLIEQNLQQMPN